MTVRVTVIKKKLSAPAAVEKDTNMNMEVGNDSSRHGR